MVGGGESPNELKSLICEDKGAWVIGSQVVYLLREGEFPKLSTDELHGVQLCLELILDVSDEDVDDLTAESPTY